MIEPLLWGACLGVGLWAFAVWLVPPKPSLHEVLATLSAPPSPVADTSPVWRVKRRIAGIAGSFGLPTARLRADLTVVGGDVERHLVAKAIGALAGAALVSVIGLALVFRGDGLPWVTSAGAIAAFAAVGFLLPDFRVREAAQSRRSAFRHALSAYLNLVRILLAGGAGVDSALADAAEVGTGWAFHQLRQALVTAQVTRTTPWEGLERLGEDLEVRQLSDLAAAVGLAGTDGAKIRSSLASKARALRTRELTDSEGEARAATERMSLPLVLLMLGFLLFIGYPALVSVLNGL
ncbi:Type II secretion system (T2SS), protein F [Lentzea xinjiangensis]|uniref:Type II secretion system (T2SS), protein F n=1 Tax=Lentzea xinjiangensis TaxID=402600 RepID=A0A1H9L976_9PSEU|nr:type II secretion system F family protein [Lentzea xinjiangensis]SER08061.1 Type II secretion system (T2SS), protein F [Lentzea xinjiangensis]